jgi:hypothetical protein
VVAIDRLYELTNAPTHEPTNPRPFALLRRSFP